MNLVEHFHGLAHHLLGVKGCSAILVEVAIEMSLVELLRGSKHFLISIVDKKR